MRKRIAMLSGALVLLAGAFLTATSVAAGDDIGGILQKQCDSATEPCLPLVSTIAFVSTRDNPTFTPTINAAEIYLMDADATDPRRLTNNLDGDGFPVLSPNGRTIVFDSNRTREPVEPLNTTAMFLMDRHGDDQTHLLRGGSAAWSGDGKNLVFHRSASGTGLPVKPDPGAATTDSDIFMMNVDDFLAGLAQPTNITNNPAAVDDDPDWSGATDRILFTSHNVGDEPNPSSAEIYTINPNGTGLYRVTNNMEEERAAEWSPDGAQIAYSCRTGGTDLEICVINADGLGRMVLTDNTLADIAPSWSPDGTKLVFQRPVAGRIQLWTMSPDGNAQTQLTNTAGINLSPQWGVRMVTPGDE